jgi:hypothetical protein
VCARARAQGEFGPTGTRGTAGSRGTAGTRGSIGTMGSQGHAVRDSAARVVLTHVM